MKSQRKDKGVWRSWFELVRLPNLFTVPGDVLAGCAVAASGGRVDFAQLLMALIASLCLYAAGLIMNDLVDEEEDRKERPERPVASGAVSKLAARGMTAFFLGFALAVLGVRGIPLLAVGALIGGLIFLYNMWAKRSRLFGSLVMGLCRAGNVLLGVVAVSPESVVLPEVVATLSLWVVFIGGISWLASRETQGAAYGWGRWIPFSTVLVGGVFLMMLSGIEKEQPLFRFWFCCFFALMLCFQSAMGLGVKPRIRAKSGRVRKIDTSRIYPQSIGLLISALIPLQAGVLILHASEPWILLAALLILFCWPLNRLLAKYFPAS